MARDPVCGMTVDPAKAAAHVEHKGEAYYFCAKGCAQKFSAKPEKYLQPAPLIPVIAPAMVKTIQTAPIALPTDVPPAAAAKQVRYTCPMHPEVIQFGPGACPKCGMALEPMDVVAEESADPEYASMSKRFWLNLILSVPVFILGMFGE